MDPGKNKKKVYIPTKFHKWSLWFKFFPQNSLYMKHFSHKWYFGENLARRWSSWLTLLNFFLLSLSENTFLPFIYLTIKKKKLSLFLFHRFFTLSKFYTNIQIVPSFFNLYYVTSSTHLHHFLPFGTYSTWR